MILSGRDLHWYVDTERIIIRPVSPDQYQQNGIDLILDDIEHHREYFDSFQLGTTREHIEVPDDIMVLVALRSTWARMGVGFSAPTIVDAGFKGTITLEISCFKPNIRVPYGERFAHLIFAKTTSPCEPYRGKYQHQSGIQPAIEDQIKDKIKK